MGNRATTERAESSENADLISRLPDDLLTRILSFVPTVTSVRTCVLSKRWSRLWISVPNMDFSGVLTESSVRQAQFKNFIDRFLSLNTAVSVRTIQFYVEEDTEISRVNAWIAAIGDHNAEEVGLYFSARSLDTSDELGFPIYRTPDKFFIQNNLVNLRLWAFVLKVPQLVCFPNLKKLDLDWIRFFDDNSLKNLLSGSPVIGNLYMNLDEGNASHTLYICSSSLRNFRLVTEALNEDYDYKIVIDTPNLRDLSVCGSACLTYSVINVSSLVRANLSFMKDKACLELLAHITNVKTLVLGEYFSSGGFDYMTLVSLPILNDLIHLEVNFNWMKYSETLFYLFKCTPNLVTLTLNKPSFGNFGLAWCEPHEIPHCFLSSIESVEINWVEDTRMISYILKNAMVLKKLTLCRSPRQAKDLVTENKFLMTLLTLPRSSATTTCQVEYYERTNSSC